MDPMRNVDHLPNVPKRDHDPQFGSLELLPSVEHACTMVRKEELPDTVWMQSCYVRASLQYNHDTYSVSVRTC